VGWFGSEGRKLRFAREITVSNLFTSRSYVGNATKRSQSSILRSILGAGNIALCNARVSYSSKAWMDNALFGIFPKTLRRSTVR
jgi:hypothetical protein